MSAAASGFGSSTIDVSLTAPDETSLAAATKQVHTAITDTPGTSETTDNLASDQPILLRPILMTAIATIFALMPMSLGPTGGGTFISQPLAVVVIGGLISSTVLTLVLVPVLYTLIERARGWRGRRHNGHRHTGQHAAA